MCSSESVSLGDKKIMWKIASQVAAILVLAGCFSGCRMDDGHPRRMSRVDMPASPPACSAQALPGTAIDRAETAEHRTFSLPTIDYQDGSELETWGMPLALQVDPSGRITCYLVEKSEFGLDVQINARRRALLAQLGSWGYRPFIREGRPVAAVVRELVYEQHLPSKKREWPDVPLDQVSISLSRSGCYGTCPIYQVTIHGDGTVDYIGKAYVDVLGHHQFKISSTEVAALVASMRDKNLWSMDPSYRARITDNPTRVLNFKVGDSKHSIEDYVGGMVGMPKAITEFEDEVDMVGRMNSWTRLSVESINALQREGFNFRSKEAAEMLLRAVTNNKGTDDRAMAKLVDLGAPTAVIDSGAIAETMEQKGPLIDLALRSHRTALVDVLLVRGALRNNGVPNQQKIDGAFRAAIVGGRLSLVQKVWDEAGPEHRPSLVFIDKSNKDPTVIQKQAPVTLLLSRQYEDQSWEGLKIAQWLFDKGCDPNASDAEGDTLLHVAARSNDVDFVRYLIARGVDVSEKGRYGLPALGSATVESVALVLLQAGSDWRMKDNGDEFIEYAQYRGWGSVLAFIASGSRK